MTKTGYERDFFAWLNAQAAHLRAKQWGALDVDNLAELPETCPWSLDQLQDDAFLPEA